MAENITPIKGTILHLQRLSTEDGPGIRTTVFFKGCPLRCAWCHNPESLQLKPQLQWIANRCIGCSSCFEVCSQHALEVTAAGILRDRSTCTVCGKCVEACPTGAMELLGQETSVEDLVNELAKDRAFFEKSGGGVTLSGGEPSLQPAFSLALMRSLKEQRISVALDTCGLCQPEVLSALAAEADFILFDLKLYNSQDHERWTGVSNERILSNLELIKNIIKQSAGSKKLWIRTPLIPKATDQNDNILSIGSFLAQQLNGTVDRWELCAFNNLCRDKYQRLDMQWVFSETPLMTESDLADIEKTAKNSSFDPQRVYVTGATRVEHNN